MRGGKVNSATSLTAEIRLPTGERLSGQPRGLSLRIFHCYHLYPLTGVIHAQIDIQGGKKMLLKLAVAAGALAIATPLAAQTAVRSESLFVVSVGRQPVPFANVSLKGGTSRVTNVDGVVVIASRDDTLNMLVRRMGFEAFQGKVGRVANTDGFRVVLSPTSQALKKVVVNAKAEPSALERTGFYDRMLEVQRGAPTGEFFTPEDLEARSGAKLSQFLYSSRFAKISQYNSRSRSRPIVYGRANCIMTILVDGVVMHQVFGDTRENYGEPVYSGARISIDDMVNAQEVMAVEVYPSIANAPMSIASKVIGSACGVVAIWTGGR